jgi:hypothetical protein
VRVAAAVCKIRGVIFKALLCSILLFVALGAFGIWLRRRRER